MLRIPIILCFLSAAPTFQAKDAYLAEGGTIVIGGSLGNEANAGGILGNLGNTEPRRGVATSLLVGSGPHGERKENPEADNLQQAK